MTASLSDLFKNKIKQIDEFKKECLIIFDELKLLLDKSEKMPIEEIKKADSELKKAVEDVKVGLNSPIITLATTGTTSGGKSTIVNMLCGAEIMPVAVQEMSAGTVEIYHHNTDKILKIPKVSGVPPECCGEWKNISDEEIKIYLTKLMNCYRDLREKHQEPPAPTIKLHYPTRLGKSEIFTNLFSDDFPIKLHIMDLPGFKHLSDDHNRKIILDKIKPALCLVTYNSEETDPVKQNELLKEVVEQVREMRGTPARMLFILNRIDVFLRDDDPEESKEIFKKTITQKIRSELEKALPEYSKVIKELQTHELSAYPALLSCLCLQNFENAEIYLKKIDKQFHFMMPEHILEDLPRKVENWKSEEQKEMAQEVWKSSYGKDFDKALEYHIFNNLPELLLPHLLSPLTDSANNAYTTCHQIIQSHLNATEENYQKELKKIEKTDAQLKELRDESKKKLLDVFSDRDDDPLEILQHMANSLEEEYDLDPDSMIPLYDWYRGLSNLISEFIRSVEDIVLGVNFYSISFFQRLSPESRKQIKEISEKCEKSGYRKYAEEGIIFEYFDEEKLQFYYLEDTIKDICKFVEKNSEGLLKNHIELEFERIQKALGYLLKEYTNRINKKANDIGKGFGGVNVVPAEIIKIKNNVSNNIEYPFSITSEKCLKDKVVTKEKEERVWYTLWLKSRLVEYEETIEEEAKESEIPSIKEVLNDFFEHFKENYLTQYRSDFYELLKFQADTFLNSVDDYHTNVLVTYKKHLENAKESAELNRSLNLRKWQDAKDKLESLKNKPEKLSKVR